MADDAIPTMMFRWDGDAMIPRAPKLADRHYVIGEDYPLAPERHRSAKSHDHEFAFVAEAWKTLPEDLADEYPTPDHLRKRALIKGGFYNETILDAGSNAAALRVAAYMRNEDDFAHVVVRGPLVVKRTAKSQAKRAMNRVEFQASKTAVMSVIADMLGVPAEALERAHAA